MARNKKSKPVDKRDQKKPNLGKSLWGGTRAAPSVEPKNPMGEQDLEEEKKVDMDIVEEKSGSIVANDQVDINKSLAGSTEQVNKRETLFEQQEENQRKPVADKKGDAVKAEADKTENEIPELFADHDDHSDPKEANSAKDSMDSSKEEKDLKTLSAEKAEDHLDTDGGEHGKDKSASDQNKVELTNSDGDSERQQDRVSFDPGRAVFVEIHRGNIFQYYIGGLLMASKYIQNRAFPDIQSINKNFLVLTNSGSHAAGGDQVLLEVDLSGIDTEGLLIYDNYALLAVPLPVTRIKKILVNHKETQATIIKDALLFNGGFIPEDLFEIREAGLKQKFDFSSAEKNEVKQYTAQIDKFDRTLGLLAFLRNYDILIAEKSKVYKSLPTHFFYAMQAIDEGFGIDLIPKNTISEFYGYLFNDSCPADKSLLKWLFARVQQGDNFTDSDILEFGRELKLANEDSIAVRNVLSLLSNNLERKNALRLVDELKSKSALPLYIFAFLRIYGNLNSIEVARRDLVNVYSGSYGEYAFALLGFFYGYRNLQNTDERISASQIASSFIKGKAPIKFQLTTPFDYRIIEAVYQSVFWGRTSFDKDSLQIRETLAEENLSGLSHSGHFPLFERLLYGKLFQHISFIDPLEKLLEQLDFLPSEFPFASTFGIFCYRAQIKFIPYMVSGWGASGFNPEHLFYAKKDLFRYLSENRDRIDMDEMQLRIQLEKKMIGK